MENLCGINDASFKRKHSKSCQVNQDRKISMVGAEVRETEKKSNNQTRVRNECCDRLRGVMPILEFRKQNKHTRARTQQQQQQQQPEKKKQ